MVSIALAYSTNKKKQKNFFDSLVRTARVWVGYCGPERTRVTVRLFPLDPHDPCALSHILTDTPNPPPHIHAVIHKRTDDMAAAVSASDPEAATRFAVLKNVLKGRLTAEGRQRIPVLSLDPLDGVLRLLDRCKMCRAIDTAFGNPNSTDCNTATCRPQMGRHIHTGNVEPVPWVHITLRKGLAAVRNAIQGKLNFPIIMKRRLACGTKASHEMVVAYDMDSALSAASTLFHAPDHDLTQSSHGPTCRHTTDHPDDFASDIIAQEFILNHGGVVFKVYAIGNNIAVQPRANVELKDPYPDGGWFHFNSQKLNKSEPFVFDPSTGCSKATEAVMPSRKLTASIVSDLSKELGLSLIGVDLVYDTLRKTYHIIDINYFPGYKGVRKANEWLLQHICNRVLEQPEER